MKNRLSVIISTHNRPALLERTLECFLNQSLDFVDYEILVGDSLSTDTAEAVVTRLKEKYPSANLEYFYVDVLGGLTITRRVLVEHSRFDIVVQGDDDAMPAKNYLEEAQKIFLTDAREEIAIVAGKLLPTYETKPPPFVDSLWAYNQFGKYLTDFTLLDFEGHIVDIPHQYVMASNMIFRKSVFVACGGYGPDGFGLEHIYANGSGEHHLTLNVSKMKDARIVYSSHIVSHHLIQTYRFSREFFKARYFLYGIGLSFEHYRKNKRLASLLFKTKMILSSFLFHLLYLMSTTFMEEHQSLKFLRRRNIANGYLYHQKKLKRLVWLKNYVMLDEWDETSFSNITTCRDAKL
jgi:glycosyltransferase involved in cell wall biosynthesis